MVRILAITIISFVSIMPFSLIFHQFLELNHDIAWSLAVALAWLITPIVLLTVWKEKPGLEVLPVDINDTIMQEQITIARENLPRFLQQLEEGKQEAYIKFPHLFGDETEHVWGVAHSFRDNIIIASIASDPVNEISEEDMGRLKIPFAIIEDWILTNEKGESRGGYTMLAMAKIYERDYGKLPRRYAKDLSQFIDLKWGERS